MKKGAMAYGVMALCLVSLAGCGNQGTDDSQSSAQSSTVTRTSATSSQMSNASSTVETSHRESTTTSSENLKGDLNNLNQVTDEDRQLTLFYPDVFANEGTVDEAGITHLPSQQGAEELLFWVEDNTYGETPAELKDRMALTEGVTLAGNGVTGYGESVDQATGERSWSAFYWVVDTDFVANVEIRCENQTAAQQWYTQLQAGTVYLEATGE